MSGRSRCSVGDSFGPASITISFSIRVICVNLRQPFCSPRSYHALRLAIHHHSHAALPAAAGEFTAGFGEADITPELGKKPVYLAGFGQDRKAAKVHDPIMARAVVLADGDTKIALVAVDVVGLFLPSVERVRAKLTGLQIRSRLRDAQP